MTTTRYLLTAALFAVTALAVIPTAHAQITPGDPGNLITTWQTDNPGVSDPDQITISRLGSPDTYNVYWGDGSTDTGVTGEITHTYTTPGTYTVEINEDFQSFYYGPLCDGNDVEKLLSVEQWGDIPWTSMTRAFCGASNLVINATDTPDLSMVSSTSQMFDGATAMNSDLSGWDVSNVTLMSSMFKGASAFNGDISSWDVSNVTDMNAMFRDASAFDQDIGDWDVSDVTNMDLMLAGTGLSTQNYDATLIGWAGQAVQPGLTLGANDLTYCAGTNARQSLIDDDGWTINGDAAASGCDPEPTLDETCALGDFDIDSPANGGSPVVLTCEGGVATQGSAIGFHFIGDVTGPTGSFSWASDTCMIVEAPNGDGYSVGGSSGTTFAAGGWCAWHDWAFQGFESEDDGTYESTHNGVFEEVEDTGTWTFTFINDWNNTDAATLSWSDVVVTLHKVPSVATEASPQEIAETLTPPSPNPARGTSTFSVAVETGQNVAVEVFDMMGRRVQSLYNAPLAAGMAETLELDASALPAGVYVIRATGEDFAKTRRVTVVR